MLTREAIVESALHVVEQGGLEALSMRGVARRLGVTPMALYNHVHDKADLVDAVAVATAEGLQGSGAVDAEASARALNEVLAASPWLVPVLAQSRVGLADVHGDDWLTLQAFVLGLGALRGSGRLDEEGADRVFERGLAALLADPPA